MSSPRHTQYLVLLDTGINATVAQSNLKPRIAPYAVLGLHWKGLKSPRSNSRSSPRLTVAVRTAHGAQSS